MCKGDLEPLKRLIWPWMDKGPNWFSYFTDVGAKPDSRLSKHLMKARQAKEISATLNFKWKDLVAAILTRLESEDCPNQYTRKKGTNGIPYNIKRSQWTSRCCF